MMTAPLTSIRQLRAIYGEAKPRSVAKELTRLDGHCRRFLQLSPFLLMATGDESGLDVSPKGDRPGFVKILDDQHILIPDWPGNNRIDGLTNIIQDPRIALIFMIPNVKETLRINGTAEIYNHPEWLSLCAFQGKLPITVIRVKTEQIFLHCAKALMRAHLWQPETWPERRELPPAGEIFRDHAQTGEPAEDDAAAQARYAKALY